ncbi:hypothetical protein BDM02DRAFT_2811011 [Thelephora ganbajun]|uniref:Uncharacterized protein n=1 Tax=Thelephora ganbajun TaxID=370292 RepID=A0ACB6YXS8_THEGA|nr:hypothetical protein BDM02DRAFT_2811011 [Thelephora ganbajun]
MMVYTTGPGSTLSNFEVHLRNRKHRRRSRNVSVNRMAQWTFPVWGILYMLLPAYILFYLLPSQGTVGTPAALSGHENAKLGYWYPPTTDVHIPSLRDSHPLTEEKEKRSFRMHGAIVQGLSAITFLHHICTACQGGYVTQNAWIRG